MILAGQTTSFGAGGVDIFLTRMTSTGKIVWSKTYGGAGDEQIRKLKLGLDGTILIVGQTKSYGYTNGALLAMKIDLNGNIIWSVQLSQASEYSLGLDIIGTSDNGYVIAGTEYSSNAASDWLVAKVDASGALQWTKRFDVALNEDAFSLIQQGNDVIISGDSQVSLNYTGIFVKLALSDGTVISSRSYIIDGRGAFNSKLQYSSNQYRTSVHIIDGNSYAQMQEGFLITDLSLNPIASFKLTPPPYENFYSTGFYQTSDGGFIVTGSSASLNQGSLYKFDASGNLVYATQLTSQYPLTIYSATQASDQSIWVIGSENSHIVVMKLTPAGRFEYCPNKQAPRSIQPTSISTGTFSWNSVSTYNFQNPAISLSSAGFSFNIDSLCVPMACQIRLSGESAICSISDTTTYKVARTGDCGSTIQWSLPNGVYTQPINDSTLRVHFSTSGSYNISAGSTNSCSPQTASAQVMVKLAPTSVDLGADRAICVPGTVLLDARSGFQSYLWQDNSTNETFPADRSGVYFVKATNACNQSFSDTVKLTFRPVADFSIRPADTAFCISGPIQLFASGGDVYQWDPVTDLNNSGISNPIATPGSSIVYHVNITDTLCNRSKLLSSRITIVPPPALTVTKSNDVDCSVGSVLLQATGAASYEWFPGSSLSDTGISNPVARPIQTTTYTVRGTNSIGCKTTDTITVFFTKTGLSNFYLPNAFTPNRDGRNDLFRIISRGAGQLRNFSVFNRWGQLVFSTDNISQGWDGTYKGTGLPSGTYVWMVTSWNPCGGNVLQKGTVTLVR